jgi:hypothetical protein
MDQHSILRFRFATAGGAERRTDVVSAIHALQGIIQASQAGMIALDVYFNGEWFIQ